MKKLSVLRRIQQLASATFALSLVSSALGILTSSMLAHWLGPRQFGVYSYLLALTSLAGVIASLGFPTVLVRQTSVSRVSSEWSTIKGLLIHSLYLTFLVSGLIGVVVWKVGMNLGGFSRMPMFAVDLGLATIVMMSTTQTNLWSSVLQGLDRIIASVIPVALVAPLGLILSVLIVHVVNGNLSISMVLVCQIGITLLVLGLLAIMVLRTFPQDFFRAKRDVRFPGWVMNAFPFLLNSMMITVNMRTDVFLLGVMKGPEIAGIYNAATRGALLLVLPLGAMITASRPTIASLYARGEKAKLQDVMAMTSRLSTSVSLVGCTILLLFGRTLLRVLFGPPFAYGFSALAILSVSRVVNAGTGSLGPFLSMTNQPRILGMGLGAEAFLNVVFNYFLIPSMGLDGSALATGGSMVLMNILMSAWVFRKMGFDVTLFGIRKPTANEEASMNNA